MYLEGGCSCEGRGRRPHNTCACRRFDRPTSPPLTPHTKQIVSLDTTTVHATLVGDGDPITALAVGPAGGRVYAASRSLTLRAWTVPPATTPPASPPPSLPATRSWRGHAAPLACLAVDASGGLLAGGGADGCARVWDADAAHATHALRGHTGVVTVVTFHPSCLTLFTGGDDGGVRAWDLASRACVAVLPAHAARVSACVPVPSAPSLLLTAARDGLAVLWDWTEKARVAEVAVMEAVEGAVVVATGAAAQAGAHPDVSFATAGAKGAIALWSTATRRELVRVPVPGAGAPGGELTALLPLPGGSTSGGARLLAASIDGRLVEATAATAPAPIIHVGRHVVGDLDDVTDVRFVGGGGGGVSTTPTTSLSSHPTHVAVATNAADVRVIDVATRATVVSLGGHADAVVALDATLLKPAPSSSAADTTASHPHWVLASGGKDGRVCVWTPLAAVAAATAGGASVARPVVEAVRAHAGAVTGVAWSRKAAASFLVTVGDDKMVKVWDFGGVAAALADAAAGGTPPTPPAAPRGAAATAAHAKPVNAVAVSPDDALVATASADRTARLWSLPHLVPGATLRGHKRGVWDVRFSPAAKLLATASGDATLRLWSVPDGACLRSLDGHGASVLRCAWARGGSELASVGADGLLKAWSPRTGDCLCTGDAHAAKAWALDAASDGALVSGGADGRVVVWGDHGAADAAAAAATAAADAEGAQALANALATGDVRGAAALALRLKAPARLLAAVRGAAAADGPPAARGAAAAPTPRPGTAALCAALRDAAPDGSLVVALDAVRAWAARARTCHDAARLLAALAATFPPSTLLAVPGAASTLDAALAYTSRHARRAERLLEATYVVDAALADAGEVVSEGEEGGDAGAARAARLEGGGGDPHATTATTPDSAQEEDDGLPPPVRDASPSEGEGAEPPAAPPAREAPPAAPKPRPAPKAKPAAAKRRAPAAAAPPPPERRVTRSRGPAA